MKVKVRACAAAGTLTVLGCAGQPAPCVDAASQPTAAAGAPDSGASFQARPAGTVYAIAFGEQELVISPADGGRTVAFSLAGKNILREREDSPDAYGSSFWTSPQSDWGWPPPRELDRAPWSVQLAGRSLLLQSGAVASLALQVAQKVSVDFDQAHVTFEYAVYNRGQLPRKLAPWQNTRVAPGGLTLYPSGGPLHPDSTLTFDTSGEVAFFQHDPARYTDGVKAFADGREGWLAHVDGEHVLIKVFPDVPPQEQAPKEAEIELFVDGHGLFVEVEQQGAYTELAPGAAATWNVRWYLRKLPASVKAEPGSKELVAFVRDVIR